MFSIDYPFKKKILACGAQDETGFCLTKKNCGYIINDLGNLDEDSVFQHYQNQIERFKKELKINPKVIAYDLHSEYNSTKYAQTLAKKTKGLKYMAVQHHKAHVAGCIGENRAENKVIGVVFDNPEVGEDGQIWGGEVFIGDPKRLKRIAHLKYTPLGNGRQSYLESSQLAASFLSQAFEKKFTELEIDFVRRCQKNNQFLKQTSSNLFYTSSMSMLFDAVSALIGLREKVDYVGQGVVDLERIINRSIHVAGKSYNFTLKQDKDKFLICPEPIFQNIVQDLKKDISKSIISAVFHNTIIEIVRQLCCKIAQKEKSKDVILTGRVFRNKVLFNRLKNLLSQDGFKVITHRHFSYSDSNISFGQAVLTDAQ